MRKLGLIRAVSDVGILLGAFACSRGGVPDTTPKTLGQSPARGPIGSAALPSTPTSTSSSTPAEATAPTGKVYDESVRSIEVQVGERFTIRLPANITTPYKWTVEPPRTEPPPVVLAERHYQDSPPYDCPACVGYPGTDALTFEARALGKTTLTMRYAPIRATTEPPERELVVQVAVKQR